MRIGIDNISPGLSTSQQALGGMQQYLQSLVRHLPEKGSEHEFQLFTPAWADSFELPPVDNLRVVNCKNVPRNRISRAIYEQFLLPIIIQSKHVAIWLGTCNTLPILWRGRSVLFVQSLQYLTQPDTYRWPRRNYLRALVPASIRRADRIVAFSQSSKDEIIRRFKIHPDKVIVIYHAFRFPNHELEREDALKDKSLINRSIGSDKYILCVSAFYPYKNLQRLLESFARLKPDFPHKLVLIGGETHYLSQADLMDDARRLQVETDVVILGRIPDEQLPTFYRNATVFAMPSLDETFGLPVLEAMAFGCPVVTSNLSSMPEIVGDAGILVNPYEVESITEGLRRILGDPHLQNELVSAGYDRTKFFTTQRFFQQLVDVIESIVTEILEDGL